MALKFISNNIHELTEVVAEIKERRGDYNYYIIKCFPWPMLAVLTSYLMFTKLGPKMMNNRKPYKLNSLMIFYNFLQVFLNFWLTYLGFSHVLFVRKTSLICEAMDYTHSPEAFVEHKLGMCYLLLKVLDLMDTVFIVLKKNQRQLSVLHIYHHAGMILCSFAGLFFVPNGTSVWLPMINTPIHAIMYSYYLLTTLNPKYKKNLWMKKSLTKLQMIQFIFLVIVYSSAALKSDCQYPKIPAGVFSIQCFIMFFMFYDFYRKAYMKRKVHE